MPKAVPSTKLSAAGLPGPALRPRRPPPLVSSPPPPQRVGESHRDVSGGTAGGAQCTGRRSARCRAPKRPPGIASRPSARRIQPPATQCARLTRPRPTPHPGESERRPPPWRSRLLVAARHRGGRLQEVCVPFGVEGFSPARSRSRRRFRATLFHCGALCRLGELASSPDWTVSSVSGGSAGVLTRWSALLRGRRHICGSSSSCFCHRRSTCPRSLAPPAGAAERPPRGGVRGAPLRRRSRTSDRPRFVFNAFATGVSFRFRSRAGDYRIGGPEPEWRSPSPRPASPFLSPVVVKTDPAAFGRRSLFGRLSGAALTDGGAYDNPARDGVEPLRDGADSRRAVRPRAGSETAGSQVRARNQSRGLQPNPGRRLQRGSGRARTGGSTPTSSGSPTRCRCCPPASGSSPACGPG